MNWFLQHQMETLISSRYIKDGDVLPPLVNTFYTSSIEVDGVTFTFNRPVLSCYSCLGDPVVISEESFSITSITPASGPVVNTSSTSTMTMGNGTMLNPTGVNLKTKQGFDKLIEDYISYDLYPTTGITEYFQTTYDSTSNIDPANNGPIIFNIGTSGSVVKSIRTLDTSENKIIEKYVVLTVVPTVPIDGFFRPPMAGVDKSIPDNWRESRINYNILRKLSPQSGQITMESALNIIKKNMPAFGLSAKKLKNFNTETNNSDYVNNALLRSDALSLLHNNLTNKDKRLLLLRVIQHGIDMYGEYLNGYTGQVKMNREYGREAFMYFAAFGLEDVNILQKAKSQIGATLKQHFWVAQSNVGQETRFPSDSRYSYLNKTTYRTEDIGIPEWEPEPESPNERNSSILTDFRNSYQAGMMDILNIALLKDGFNGITGINAILDNGPFNNTNPRAASLAYYDRMSYLQDQYLTVNYLSSNGRRAIWNTRRQLITLNQLDLRPDIIEPNTNQITENLGVVTYDISNIFFSKLPITRLDVRYSLDNIQWVELTDVININNINNLTKGLDHYFSFRATNSAGSGKWTKGIPRTGSLGTSPSRRNKTMINGTEPIKAVLMAQPPLIFNNAFDVDQEDYDITPNQITTTFMSKNRKVLICGLGYWSGYPAPSFSFQWRANDVNIPGETNKTLTLDWYKYSGKNIDCGITPFGGSVVYTQKVLVPVEVEPAAPSNFTRVRNAISSEAFFLQRPKAFENVVNGAKGTIAFKGKITGTAPVTKFLSIGNGAESSDILRLVTDTNSKLRLMIRNTSGAALLDHTTVISINSSTDEFTILISWDLSAGLFRIYLNGVSLSNSPVIVDGIIAYDSIVKNTVLATGDGVPGNILEMDYFYFNTAEYIDFSVAANRDKFSSAVNLGAWGKGPTGNRPTLFLSGNADKYNYGNANMGIGNQLEVKSNSSTIPVFVNV